MTRYLISFNEGDMTFPDEDLPPDVEARVLAEIGALAAEMTARTGHDPAAIYREFRHEFGEPVYERLDAPATPEQKERLAKLSPQRVKVTELAGEKIQTMLTQAPGNHAPIGGMKVIAENGWFAARPSGTENIYKIYAESFHGVEHLQRILAEAQTIVNGALTESPLKPAILSKPKRK